MSFLGAFVRKHMVPVNIAFVGGLAGLSVLLTGIVAVGRYDTGLPVWGLCAALLCAVSAVVLVKGRMTAYAAEGITGLRPVLYAAFSCAFCYYVMERFFGLCFAGPVTGGEGPRAAQQLYALLPFATGVKSMALKLATGGAAVLGTFAAFFIITALLRFLSGAFTGVWYEKCTARGGRASRLAAGIAAKPEIPIFLVLLVQMLAGLACDMTLWAKVWYVTDYSLGFGPRMFIGTVMKLLFGAHVYDRQAYALTVVALLADMALISAVLGKGIRMSGAKTKNAVTALVAVYLASPFSVAYLWNSANMGRLDVYLLLCTLLAIMAWMGGKNRRLTYVALGCLSVCAVLIHQVYVFIYFPLLFTLICIDTFRYDHLDKKALRRGITVCGVTAAAFSACQFITCIKFPTVRQLVAHLVANTDLEIFERPLALEYYLPFSDKLVDAAFFYKNNNPFGNTLATLVLLSPWLYVMGRVAVGQLRAARPLRKSIWYGPEIYILASGLMFLPAFAIMMDWGRWFAPLFAGGLFTVVCLISRQNRPTDDALRALNRHVLRSPDLYVFAVVLFLCLERFKESIFMEQARLLCGWAAALAGQVFG